MLTGQRQYHYLSALLESASGNLVAFRVKADPESLHRFRVDMKKFRAWLPVLQTGKGDRDWKRLMKKVQIVYRKAGDIRTLDVSRELLIGLHFPDRGLVTELEERIIKKTKRFIGSMDEYLAAFDQLRHRLRGYCTDVDNDVLFRRFDKKIKKLEKRLDHRRTRYWHASRRRLKTLMYASKLLPASVKAQLGINLAWYSKLQHAMGRWHDLVSLRHLPIDSRNRRSAMWKPVKALIERRRSKVARLLETRELK